jgi:endonuclease/exonuclease/phosphatase family metal-dependent hydrolase
VVLLGDLNLTPYSPPFDRLLGDSGLRDVMQGQGWQPTWRAGFWPLALRIDHVLVSSDLCVEDATVGPTVGSDHRPVLARLRL